MTGARGRPEAPTYGRAWTATALVKLYPRPWRERYGDELLDLLQCRRLTLAAVFSTVRGALEAHVDLPDLLPGWSCGSARLRWSVTTTFGAWAAFCVAAAGVVKSTEAPAFGHAIHASPAQGVAWVVASIGFILAALAIAYAGVPLAAVAIRQALRRRDRVAFRLFAIPMVSVAALTGSGALLGRLLRGSVHDVLTSAVVVGWLTAVVLAVVAVVRSAAALVRRTDVPTRLLRHAAWATVFAATAMSGGLLAGGGYALAVMTGSPRLFSSANGVLSTPLPLTWAVAALLAGAAALVADRAALRALRSLRTSA